MDHSNSRPFPGFGCLLALLTLWFLPAGEYILAFAVIVLLLSGTEQLMALFLRKRSKIKSRQRCEKQYEVATES